MTKIYGLGMLLLALSGCADFHEKIRTDQDQWSLAQGQKTLMVRGYATDESKIEVPCGRFSQDALLMPDNRYFRDWLNVLASARTWKAHPSKQAQVFIRHAKWQDKCIFTFNNVPDGKWLLILDMQHHQVTGSLAIPNGPVRTNTSTLADLTYAPLSVTGPETEFKKTIVMDYSKRTDIGFFKFRKMIVPAEVYDWTTARSEVTR